MTLGMGFLKRLRAAAALGGRLEAVEEALRPLARRLEGLEDDLEWLRKREERRRGRETGGQRPAVDDRPVTREERKAELRARAAAMGLRR